LIDSSFHSFIMFITSILRTSRTTYRGSRGSGAGNSSKTSARSSPASRPTLAQAIQSGKVFKRSQRGLYDGSVLQTGNSIPKSVQKTLRSWKPNVQNHSLRSDILGTVIQTRVTSRALRTISKYGGLDAYLQRRDDKLLGTFGRTLRSVIAATVREKQLHQNVPAN
jgi:large subunit ribosomal protein L28